MDQGDGGCSLAHRRRDTLHRALAHVPDGEDTWKTRFQESGWPLQRPPLRQLAVTQEIAAREDEAARVTARVRAPGSAPIRMNNAAAGTVSVSPVAQLRSSRPLNCPVPCAPTTSVVRRTSMFAVAAISAMRYSDMLLARESERTRIVTCAAYLAS